MQSEKPRIQVKTKNLQLIFDYCIETKTEFTVIPRNSNDDWEIELNIRSIKDAIRWGMFLKTNKIELIDTAILINPIPATKTVQPTIKTKKDKTIKATSEQTVSNTSQQSIQQSAIDNLTNTIESEEKSSETIFDFTEQNTNSGELF